MDNPEPPATPELFSAPKWARFREMLYVEYMKQHLLEEAREIKAGKFSRAHVAALALMSQVADGRHKL